jgi:flagellar basal body L-ring protein FlgH
MIRSIALLVVAIPLAACEVREDTADTNTAAPATEGVVREQAAATEAPPVQPMAAATVIQSQPGPDGSQVDLLSARVTGDILTVTMRCSSEERYNSESFRIANISVIDDATSQRSSVLRDSEGNAMVSDFNKASSRDNDSLSGDCGSKGGVIWARFPAPPATSQTISISFPEVGPFDGIPVQR